MPDDFEARWARAKALAAQPPSAPPVDNFEARWARAKAKAEAKPSSLESAGRGALQGATVGFGDEIAGGMTEAIQTAVNILPESIQRRLDVVPSKFGEAYRFSRDEERRANTAAEEANPNAYLAGNVAGGVLTGKAVPVGQVLKGGKLLARLGNAALSGAGQGAAYGLGRSEAELGEGEVGRAAMDTVLGGALGAAGGALGEGARSGGKALLEAVRQRAARGIQEAVTPVVVQQATTGGAGGELRAALAEAAPKLAPAVLGGVGALLGGSEGGAAGGAIGSALGFATGQTGAALRQLARTPAVRQAAWEAVQKAAGTGAPGAMSRAAGLLERLSPQARSRALSRLAIDKAQDTMGAGLEPLEADARAEALRRRRR